MNIDKNFVLVGNNRQEAYESYFQWERNHNEEFNMSFDTFCAELSLGYGKSNYLNVSRHYEMPNGKIYYDNAWESREEI